MSSYQNIDIKSIIERCRALLYPEYLGDSGAAQHFVKGRDGGDVSIPGGSAPGWESVVT